MRKITKAEAKKRYNKGEKIYLNPSKMRVNSFWWSAPSFTKRDEIERGNDGDFEKLVNAFWYYNCNSEMGKVVHYYID